MMKILFLDDDEARHLAFRKRVAPHVDVVYVWTADEAIRALDAHDDLKLICLDHDLGGTVYADSGPGTGYEVAKYLAENASHTDVPIIIHSFNPLGAENMDTVIYNADTEAGRKPRAVRMPFNSSKFWETLVLLQEHYRRK